MRKALTTLTAVLALVGAALSAGAHPPGTIDLAMVDPAKVTPSDEDTRVFVRDVSSHPAYQTPVIIHGPSYEAPLRIYDHYNRSKHEYFPADDRFELR